MSVRKEVDNLREAIKAARGITPKAVAEAGGVKSYSSVYRFVGGDGIALSTVLQIEKGWLTLQAKAENSAS